MRIAIVGSSCAGKTTLACRLSGRLALPHIELDALHWGPDWTETPAAEFRQQVDLATAADNWVCDGNYAPVRNLVWQRAQMLVWLDDSFPTVFGRALRRTFARALSGEDLYNGNRETFRKALASRDSILLWVLQSYRRGRRELAEQLRRPEHAHLEIIEHRWPRDTAQWFEDVAQVVEPRAKA